MKKLAVVFVLIFFMLAIASISAELASIQAFVIAPGSAEYNDTIKLTEISEETTKAENISLVKTMPNKISERAKEVLGIRCEERNCTIELVSFGKENNTRLAYNIRIEKDSKILLLFKKKMSVVAQIDDASGEIISIKKPWWSFLAKEYNRNIANQTANEAQ